MPDIHIGRNLTQNLTSFKTYISERRVDDLGSAVAFHAELGPHKYNLTGGQTIRFETIKENVGNAYNPNTGIFTCTKSGLYFFTFTILAFSGDNIETKLLVNETPVMYSFSDGETTLDSASNSVVVSMKNGDSARAVFHYSDNGHSVFGHQYSTLTGFLFQNIY